MNEDSLHLDQPSMLEFLDIKSCHQGLFVTNIYQIMHAWIRTTLDCPWLHGFRKRREFKLALVVNTS